jgi:site-specific recombinase XerD
MPKEKPLPQYLNDFLDYLEIEKGLSNKTQENYSRFLNRFFKWLQANNLYYLPPSQLTKDHVWKYRLHLSRHTDPKTKKTLKKSTQNYYLIALRCLLQYFVEKDINTLPPSKIKLAKNKGGKEVNFLKLEQIKKLLNAPDTNTIIGLRNKAILEVLFSTGLRISELTALNRDQFKIKSNTEDLEIAILGKGESVRTVYFSARAIDALRKYLNARKDMDEALFINYKPGIEKTDTPRRLTPKSIETIFKTYIKWAGLPINSTPHTLRHSFATDLLNQGVDLRLVQEFLGHKNISTTQIYTHVTNKKLRDIHKKAHGGNQLD